MIKRLARVLAESLVTTGLLYLLAVLFVWLGGIVPLWILGPLFLVSLAANALWDALVE